MVQKELGQLKTYWEGNLEDGLFFVSSPGKEKEEAALMIIGFANVNAGLQKSYQDIASNQAQALRVGVRLGLTECLLLQNTTSGSV